MSENNENGQEQKSKYRLRTGDVKGNLRTILLTALCLAVTVISATVYFLSNMDQPRLGTDELSIFLSVLTLICWAGCTLLAIFTRDASQSKAITVIFAVSLLGYIVFLMSMITESELTPIFGIISFSAFAMISFVKNSGFIILIYAALIAANLWNWLRSAKWKNSK